jgi:hypothetical protein
VIPAQEETAMITDAEADVRLAKYIDAIRYLEFDSGIRAVFPRLTELDRRLYALKRFIFFKYDGGHGEAWIDDRWAMSREEFQAWRRTAAGQLRNRELNAVIASFARANPGYQLRERSLFRPLGEQIDNWNISPSVRVPSQRYHALARTEIKRTAANGTDELYPDLGGYLSTESGLLSLSVMPQTSLPGIPADPRDETARRWAGVRRLRDFMKGPFWHGIEITVATPGLSGHGVGQAVDFQVLHGGTVLCGPSSRQRGTWRTVRADVGRSPATALANAMRVAPHFSGPLNPPDEPWHWTFNSD